MTIQDDHFHLYETYTLLDNTATRTNTTSEEDTPRRVRLTYFYGFDTIPADIERLALIITMEHLRNASLDLSFTQGRSDFNESNPIAHNEREKQRIIGKYKQLEMTNV
jgi:hypothetical protein